jgi:hypothetical protein
MTWLHQPQTQLTGFLGSPAACTSALTGKACSKIGKGFLILRGDPLLEPGLNAAQMDEIHGSDLLLMPATDIPISRQLFPFRLVAWHAAPGHPSAFLAHGNRHPSSSGMASAFTEGRLAA